MQILSLARIAVNSFNLSVLENILQVRQEPDLLLALCSLFLPLSTIVLPPCF